MGDITDLFSTVSRTKVVPAKGYQANFTTSSTVFVDVTGLSVSVPNNAFYAFKGTIGAVSISTTTTYQVLLGASVIKTGTVVSGGGGGNTAVIDTGILQNTQGSTQTLKVQIKVDVGTNTGSVTPGSIGTGTIVLPMDSTGYGIMDIWSDISSLSFTGIAADVYYDGIPNLNSSNNISTWSIGSDKTSQIIRFFGSTSGYVAFDFSGKILVT